MPTAQETNLASFDSRSSARTMLEFCASQGSYSMTGHNDEAPIYEKVEVGGRLHSLSLRRSEHGDRWVLVWRIYPGEPS